MNKQPDLTRDAFSFTEEFEGGPEDGVSDRELEEEVNRWQIHGHPRYRARGLFVPHHHPGGCTLNIDDGNRLQLCRKLTCEAASMYVGCRVRSTRS